MIILVKKSCKINEKNNRIVSVLGKFIKISASLYLDLFGKTSALNHNLLKQIDHLRPALCASF
jgi:hypothetical protein